MLLAGGQAFAAPLRIDAGDTGTVEQPVAISSYGTGRAAIVASGGDGILVENSQGITIHGLDVWADDGYHGPGSGVHLVVNLPGDVKLSGVTVEDVLVMGFDQYGVFVEGNNGKSGFRDLTIERVIAQDNLLGGIVVEGEFSMTSSAYAHAGIFVRDSRVSGSAGVPGADRPHSGSGIILSDVDGGLIERCVAHDNGWISESRAGGPVGIWAWDANEVVIQFNESYNNRSRTRDGGGFDLDGGATRSVLQYNYSHDNAGAGFAVISFPYNRPTFGNVIRYNISANDSRSGLEHGGILIHGQVADTLIYHNTVYLGGMDVGDARQAALQVEPLARSAPGDPQPRGTRILNNLFVTGDALPMLRVTAAPEGVTLQGNGYFAGDGQPTFVWGGEDITELDAWRATTGQERRNGVEVGSSADPRLLRPDRPPVVGDPARFGALAAYRVDASSPLVDASSPLVDASSPLVDAGISLDDLIGVGPAITHDFFGSAAPRGRGPDVGAHEAGGRP